MNNRIRKQIDNTIQKCFVQLCEAESKGDMSAKTRVTVLEKNITKLVTDILRENPLIFNQ